MLGSISAEEGSEQGKYDMTGAHAPPAPAASCVTPIAERHAQFPVAARGRVGHDRCVDDAEPPGSDGAG
jgi:hypothetical protein